MTNNNNASATANSGFGVFSLAFIVLLVFKLAGLAGVSWGLANLSWFWVISPLIIGFVWVMFWLVLIAIVVTFVNK